MFAGDNSCQIHQLELHDILYVFVKFDRAISGTKINYGEFLGDYRLLDRLSFLLCPRFQKENKIILT